jgi:hypothetical protein
MGLLKSMFWGQSSLKGHRFVKKLKDITVILEE